MQSGRGQPLLDRCACPPRLIAASQILILRWLALFWACFCLQSAFGSPRFTFESLILENGDAPITLNVAYQPATTQKRPVILMLGSIKSNQLPNWSTNLVREGYMLAAFAAAHPADPDPARRPVWLYFDQRFAHSYVQGAKWTISDSRKVINHLAGRGDVDTAKIGWLGSSSTGIPGLAVATQGPRLAAVVAFVSTGAYRQWFDTWQPNGLWKGQTNSLWPETEALLREYDPILYATNLYPTAVLMVSGGGDKVVDPKTARTFVDAARLAYKSDTDRLRFVVYEGFGHNLPADVVRLYAEHWFHLYMSPSDSVPAISGAVTNLDESVVRSQINAEEHRKLMGASGENGQSPRTNGLGAERTDPSPPALSPLQGERERSSGVRSNPTPRAGNVSLPTSSPTNRAKALEWIKVSPDKRGFVAASSGKRFTPWGFNYDRDYKFRLLEDYWEADWPTVVEDFREMKQLGANVVRIHLQFGKFMKTPDRPNEKSLEHLSALVRLAEDTGLYLDLTGLACYRKQDTPAWYNSLSESNRWRAQANFWEAVAARCEPSPAIFCYDLINEPFVPNDPRLPGDWYAGPLAGFYYLQAVTLIPGTRDHTDIARAWTTNLTTAIRKQDQRHLITVGLLPNSAESGSAGSGFEPTAIRNALNFIAVHVYPKTGKFKQELANLDKFRVGKPLVIEETFPMLCGTADLSEFIRSTKSKAPGWISFYWGQTPEELKRSNNPADKLQHDWLELFRKTAP
jgi:dienelactone hydrolase